MREPRSRGTCTCSATSSTRTEPALLALFEQLRAQRVERAAAIVQRVNQLTGAADDGRRARGIRRGSARAPAHRPRDGAARDHRGAAITPSTPSGSGPMAAPGSSGTASPSSAAIAAIHAPAASPCSRTPERARRAGLREDAVRDAASDGLDGIEVDHPEHDGDVVQRCAELAVELGLVQTAGSDDHGHGADGSRLGCRTVPVRIVDALAARAAARRARLAEAVSSADRGARACGSRCAIRPRPTRRRPRPASVAWRTSPRPRPARPGPRSRSRSPNSAWWKPHRG